MAMVATWAAPVISCRLSSLVEMLRMDEASTSTSTFFLPAANCSELPTTESVPTELFLTVSPPITSLTPVCTTLGAAGDVPAAWPRAGTGENIKGAPTARRKSPRAQTRGLAARGEFVATETSTNGFCMFIVLSLMRIGRSQHGTCGSAFVSTPNGVYAIKSELAICNGMTVCQSVLGRFFDHNPAAGPLPLFLRCWLTLRTCRGLARGIGVGRTPHSFDGAHEPIRQFALHHVRIHQPENPLWHLEVCGKQDDRNVGKPLVDLVGDGFGVYALLFVLQQNSIDRRFLQHFDRGMCARYSLNVESTGFQNGFANLQQFWLVVDAKQSGVHGAFPLDGTKIGSPSEEIPRRKSSGRNGRWRHYKYRLGGASRL